MSAEASEWQRVLTDAAEAWLDAGLPYPVPYATSENEFLWVAERAICEAAKRRQLDQLPCVPRRDGTALLKEDRDRVLRRTNGQCEWPQMLGGTAIRCDERAVHIHHRLRRVDGGTNAQVNLMALCVFHHRFTHSRAGRNEAIELGILVLP